MANNTELEKASKIRNYFDLFKRKTKRKGQKVWMKLKKKKKSVGKSLRNSIGKSRKTTKEEKCTSGIEVINDSNGSLKSNSILKSNNSMDINSSTTIQTKEEPSDYQCQEDNIPEPPIVVTPSPNHIAKQKIMNKFLSLNTSASKRIELVKDEIQIYNDGEEEYHEEMCDQISLAIEDWNGMKSMYSKELRKRKSRLNKDDLQTQHAMLVQLRERICLINDESKTKIPNSLDIDDYYNHNSPLTPSRKSKKMEKDSSYTEERKPLEIDFDKEWWAQYQDDDTKNKEKENIDLNVIQQKDDLLDTKLQKVDDLLNSMKSIANAQGDEINGHEKLIGSIEQKSNSMNDKMGSLNRKANDTSSRV